MSKKTMTNLYYVGVVIFFSKAVWSWFFGPDDSVFLAEFQTGLLFLILAGLQNAYPKQ